MADNTPILKFQGVYRFLSNFYIEPDGTCVECEYQGAKTKPPTNLTGMTPGQAKRCGKSLPLRKDWEWMKEATMLNLVQKKFADHPELATKLLATGKRELEEGNNWGDRFWGISPHGSGNGQNELGEILMQVRHSLRRNNK